MYRHQLRLPGSQPWLMPYMHYFLIAAMRLFSPFYRLREGGTERLSDLCKVTQPVKVELGFESHLAAPEASRCLLCCCFCLSTL